MKRWPGKPVELLISLTLCAALVVLAACKAPDGAGVRSSQTASTTNSANANAASRPPVATNAAQATASPADGIARISVADARREAEAGRAVFVDVRTKAEFDRGHIKGAVSLPKAEIPARFKELPGNKTLILYCA